jgi:hypothetical protein
MYLDLTFCFFFMSIQLFERNEATEPSCLRGNFSERTSKPRQMSPFLLNLNLKPLYSRRGGSTICAEPFIKKPTSVDLRWKPLYK